MKVSGVRIASAVLPASRLSITANASSVASLASVSRTAGMTGPALQHIAGCVSRRDHVAAEGITYVNRGASSFDCAFGGDLRAQLHL